MSYSNKYLIEFQSIHGNQWKIDVQQDGWAGQVFTPIATGDPLHFEFDSESDTFNEPIRPSKATFNVRSLSDFQFLDFYTDEDFRLKSVISLNGVLFWQGYIVTGEYEEPYDQVPYPVKITAIDGLNYLKQTLYCESEVITSGSSTITYYEGRQVESKIVLDILGKIGYTAFKEYVNIYDAAMDNSISDSPFDQTVIDVDVFRDMNCWDVLTEILKKYNAVIRQVNGEIVIYRPTELIQATVFGRSFTAWNTKTAISYVPDQYIKRSGNSSTLKQFPGSALMIKRPAKKITINQDYGYKKSWIDNWEFKSNTFSGSGTIWNCQKWTKTNTYLIQTIKIIGETDGVLIVEHNNYPVTDHYLSQSFGEHLIVTSDTCFIEFDFLLYNAGSVLRSGEHIYVMVKSDNASKFLYAVDDIVCAWSNTSTRIDIAIDAPVGSTGWVNFKRQIPGIPTAGSYTIYLFALDDAYTDVYLAFKNIRMYSTSDFVTTHTYPWYQAGAVPGFLFSLFGPASFKKKFKILHDIDEVVSNEYVLENAIKGVDIGVDIKLADVIDNDIDNIIEQFQGALAVNNSPIEPSTSWSASGGTPAPLVEVIGGEIGQQYSRPKQLIQMNVQEYEETPYSFEGGEGAGADSTIITSDSTAVTSDMT